MARTGPHLRYSYRDQPMDLQERATKSEPYRVLTDAGEFANSADAYPLVRGGYRMSDAGRSPIDRTQRGTPGDLLHNSRST